MAGGIFLITLVLALAFAAPPAALFTAIFAMFLHDRLPRGAVVVLVATALVVLAYAASAVLLLFLAMVAPGNVA